MPLIIKSRTLQGVLLQENNQLQCVLMMIEDDSFPLTAVCQQLFVFIKEINMRLYTFLASFNVLGHLFCMLYFLYTI